MNKGRHIGSLAKRSETRRQAIVLIERLVKWNRTPARGWQWSELQEIIVSAERLCNGGEKTSDKPSD